MSGGKAATLAVARRQGWEAAQEYQRDRHATAHGVLWRLGGVAVAMYAGSVVIMVPWLACQEVPLNPRAWTFFAFSLAALVPAFFMWRRADKLDRAQNEAFMTKWHPAIAKDTEA